MIKVSAVFKLILQLRIEHFAILDLITMTTACVLHIANPVNHNIVVLICGAI